MDENKLTITIKKPIIDVFAYCITPPNAKYWVPSIIDEKTDEWPVKIGTIYTEYKGNTSFNMIVTDYKENEYVEWKTEDGNYKVRYILTCIDNNTTKLDYIEAGEIIEPFTQDILEILKKVVEDSV